LRQLKLGRSSKTSFSLKTSGREKHQDDALTAALALIATAETLRMTLSKTEFTHSHTADVDTDITNIKQ
jgi:hypothetical protein